MQVQVENNEKGLFTFEQVRDRLQLLLSERQDQKQQNIELARFDQLFKETVFSQQALSLKEIEAILKDRQNNPSYQNLKNLFKYIKQTLISMRDYNQKKTCQGEKHEPKQPSDDQFNFDSDSRQKQSSEDDVDDDYVKDLKQKQQKVQKD